MMCILLHMMNTTQPTLTNQLRDGQLEHVIVVGGQKAQAHSSLKTAMSALLLAMALTGCETCERHPVACGTAFVFVAGSLAASAGRHGTQSPEPDRQMSIPLTPNCNVYPEMCK